MRLIPAPYRILALVLLVLACIGFGYVQGIVRESDRREALELVKEREASKAFQRALASGKRHAGNVIAWQNKARIYYRNWQERLNHENDSQLAQCQTQPGQQAQAGIPGVLLSGTWLGLYNAAWLPEFDSQDNTGGAAYQIFQAGAPSTGLRAGVTPRAVLDNVRINAELCGEDRKRLDELIDHLNEVEAGPLPSPLP